VLVSVLIKFQPNEWPVFLRSCCIIIAKVLLYSLWELFFCYLSITLMYFVTVAEYIIGLFSFYSTIVKTGCWFVGGDDLTGALHDLYLE